MKTVVITRSLWGTNYLKRPDNGKQCCLGFVCKKHGLTNKDILRIASPRSLPVELQGFLPSWMTDKPINLDLEQAIWINDNDTITMAEKEAALKPLFLKHDIKLVFRGPLS
jgi:hypothetical protein